MYGTRILKRQIGSDARQLREHHQPRPGPAVHRAELRAAGELSALHDSGQGAGGHRGAGERPRQARSDGAGGRGVGDPRQAGPAGPRGRRRAARKARPRPLPSAAPGGPPEDPEQAANRALSAAAEEKNRTRGDRYERALEAAIDAAEDPEFAKPVSEELVGPLLAAARQDPETLLGRLAEVYSGASTRELQAKLGRVLAVANVWGRISADGDR